jgi:eukaryotic-like serine/threonine-protein kinase
MSAQPALHPTDEALRAYGLGRLDDSSAVAVNRHLESCPDCRWRVAERTSDSFRGQLREAGRRRSHPTVSHSHPDREGAVAAPASPTPARPPAETMPPGLADHPDFEILRELGRGGMGVIYPAHNRLLSRDEVLEVMNRHAMEGPGFQSSGPPVRRS